MKNNPSSWHIGVAAEAYAAGLFARCGFDVSVQYGANQPEYDLIIVKGNKLFKVSVKGSKDGSWGLTQSYLRSADYHGAIETWLSKHKGKTIFCLVQFKDTGVYDMPRIYLATPAEIAKKLKDSAKKRGDTMLYEYHKWSARAYAYGTIERIPDSWKFTPQRIEELFDKA